MIDRPESNTGERKRVDRLAAFFDAFPLQVKVVAEGATVHDLASGADAYGNSYFFEQYQVAGNYGAGSFTVAAWTYDGNAGYYDSYSWSSPEGAWTTVQRPTCSRLIWPMRRMSGSSSTSKTFDTLRAIFC